MPNPHLPDTALLFTTCASANGKVNMSGARDHSVNKNAALSLANDAMFVKSKHGEVEYIIGVDEAGRGCMAGPVGVAAICFRVDSLEAAAVAALPQGIQDSKAMKAVDRCNAFVALLEAVSGVGGSEATVKSALASTLQSAEKQFHVVVSSSAPATRTLGISAVLVDAAVIDRLNILNATLEGMSSVCAELVVRLRRAGVDITAANTRILIDGNRTPWHFLTPERRNAVRAKAAKSGNNVAIGATHAALEGLPCSTVVGGDGVLYAVAAASVVAKVLRDAFTVDVMHQRCPLYGFDDHKGYVTATHKERLVKYGPCEFHRRSYAPVAALCDTGSAAATTTTTKAVGGRKRAPSRTPPVDQPKRPLSKAHQRKTTSKE